MTCRYCGTELPETAMFCGECGRSLAVSVARPRAVNVPEKVVEPAALPEALPASAVEVKPELRVEIEPELEVEPESEPELESELGLESELQPEGEPEPGLEAEKEPRPEGEQEPGPEPTLEVAEARVVEEHFVEASAAPLVFPEERDRARPPAMSKERSEPLDDEDTRIVARDSSGTRFVLQFSTGETHTVSGTGLIGRNPHAEPGEYFDHRIVIVDNGKSVSKTHLEFGQTAGVLWISDRFSGNGTVIRRPQADPQRGEPGKRYLVSRGSRVDIGDQFFIVS